ncbi:DsbA family protein [Metabacillus sp. GX 13764]|uniref:DsbA family protein n=1 Tax=Metabacillus kandeliae TaxID=2900151 RepID=UPI001E3D3633|nr:thioredoxin domain-containing protein [Metabacillus kandeliae]MCD7034014.1 DsbA family protein [Metabacillus kandeliae]
MSKPTNKKNLSKKQQGKRVPWILISIGVIVIIGIIIMFVLGSKQNNAGEMTLKDQPYLGKESAPVSIVEFGDYKCPYCKVFTLSSYPEIEKQLVDTGKAKFYFLQFPFINNDSFRAAEFAETVYKELGNEAFWKFHESLYAKQPDDQKYEKMDYFTEPVLMQVLTGTAGKDNAAKVQKAFKNNEGKSLSDEDLNIGKKLQVEGTPAIFIDGKLFQGQSFDDLKNEVAQAAEKKK